MRLNFKKILMITFISLSIILLFLIYLFFHFISDHTIRQTKINDYDTVFGTVSSYLEKIIEEKNKDAEYLIYLFHTSHDMRTKHEEIMSFINTNSDIRHVILADKRGIIIDLVPYREDYVGIDISNSQIFKNSMKLNFHGPYITFLENSSTYVVSKFYEDKLILIFIEITEINSIIERLKQLGYYAFMIDSSGSVIFHVNEEIVNQGVNLSYLKPIREAITSSFEELIEVNFNGEIYLLYPKKIEKTDYFFFIGQKKELAFMTLTTLRGNLSYMLILLVVLSLILSISISNRFTEPIIRIMNSIEKIKGGDYNISVINSKIDELNRISEELSDMAQTIEDRELKLRKIFETTLDALVITTIDGDVLDFNEATAKMFGYSSKEDVPPNMKVDYFYYQDINDRTFVINQLLENGTIKNFEVTFKKIDGSIFYGLLSSTLVKDESGKILFILSIIKDITDKRKLQEQLFQSQKMESIGRLAGSIAHDFNNILSVIHSSNQLIQIHTKNDPKIERYIAAITGAVNKARDFIRKLLAFSKRQVFVPSICNLNEVLAEEIKLLKPTIREDIHLELKTTDYPLHVNLDRTHFTQILLNLTVNAMDAMPNGGRITITTEQKKFEYEHIKNYPLVKEGVFAALNFSDTGIGIPEDVKDKIFEPFFTTKPEGTGLGLATVYSIVQQHGGFINVYSEYGRGTTFKIYFPISTSKTETSGEHSEDFETTVKTILLVEDNQELRDMTEELLRTNGFEVISFSNGLEAIEKFESLKEKIDLCLFDVIMPQIGGLELYKKLKLFKPDLKVVFMTGYSDSLVQIQSLIEEGQQIIYKPFGIAELKRKIRELYYLG